MRFWWISPVLPPVGSFLVLCFFLISYRGGSPKTLHPNPFLDKRVCVYIYIYIEYTYGHGCKPHVYIYIYMWTGPSSSSGIWQQGHSGHASQQLHHMHPSCAAAKHHVVKPHLQVHHGRQGRHVAPNYKRGCSCANTINLQRLLKTGS